MWNVKPGDLVVCIKKEVWTNMFTRQPSKIQIPYGTVCTVEEVHFNFDGLMGFVLTGWSRNKFTANNFRPVTKPSIENLRSLIKNPDPVSVDA